MWVTTATIEAVALVALVVVLGPVLGLFDLRWWMITPLVLLDATYVAVVPAWRYRVHRWEVTETAVYTQTGWWSRERRVAPMSRIQTVDWNQGPVERLFGLANVTVTTASAAGALSVAGLDRRTAEQLVAELTEKADAVAGDAT
ncbi:membrane protein YdbS with pleckstrin-like domain [Nocardioides salarius]|uniref:Membrane protein YdbS with pleckstrin-like domain n=1 Tax=Nocardioides salarius TaxID=374513 RepID=A0ABS2MDS2_9ACTN|nr:PH domain-containing protein [Nocardioides salarius]MBM7509341.1 membrane protein YdbS with pleckstrin-like domain [Nocardioides salarius]